MNISGFLSRLLAKGNGDIHLDFHRHHDRGTVLHFPHQYPGFALCFGVEV